MPGLNSNMNEYCESIDVALQESHALKEDLHLPFSLYSSQKIQKIIDVPISKPTLILVLSGEKQLNRNFNDSVVSISQGQFVFLSSNTNFSMRNIPANNQYRALIIEFEIDDFLQLKKNTRSEASRVKKLAEGGNTFRYKCSDHLGTLTESLKICLQQFIHWVDSTPAELWSRRRQEILELLYYEGHAWIVDHIKQAEIPSSTATKLQAIINEDLGIDFSLEVLCERLAMSESTLRRRLKAENSSLQTIKDQAKLGYGLHLIQSSSHSISRVAESCGYQSQSRFSEKFKKRFGISPSELRKTQLTG